MRGMGWNGHPVKDSPNQLNQPHALHPSACVEGEKNAVVVVPIQLLFSDHHQSYHTNPTSSRPHVSIGAVFPLMM